MSEFRPLLLYELCCLSLLLLQAHTHGAPTTTSRYRVPDHDEFLPLVEEGTTADRQLLNAERSVFLNLGNDKTKELRIVRKFFKERSQELQGRDTLSSNDDSEEEKKLLDIQPKVQFEKQRMHGKQGKQRRVKQRDDRKKESEWTSAGRHHSHEYREDKLRCFGSVQREPLRIRGNRYCADNNVQQLGADGAEVDSEWNEQESFPPERRARELKGLPPYLPSISGCRSVDEYKFLQSIKEGAYGIVYRAWEKRTGQIVALKMLKLKGLRTGVPIAALREIGMLLKAGDHPNILNLLEVVFSSNMDKIYLVMEFIDRDLWTAIGTLLSCRGRFTTGEVKNLFRQLLSGVAYLHDNWILHRDLKPSNLLLMNEGILKIGDFGLSREYGNPPKSYSPDVITLWYRPPELLLGAQEYSTAVDMWSCGCIFAELLKMRPLFPGDGELDQIIKIFTDLGTPNDTIWRGYSRLPVLKKMKFKERAPGGLEKKFSTSVVDKKGLELLKRLLTYDPAMRLSAWGALDHEWFLHLPAPSPVYMTVYEQGRREKRKSTMKTSPTRVVGAVRHEGVEIDKSLEGLQIETKVRDAA